MSFGDQMKQKADEVHLQDKAKDFGDAVAEVVKAAVGMASHYAAENRPKVDGMLDKAEAKIGEKAGPKHAETITKARSKVDQGLDKVSEKAPETGGPTRGDRRPGEQPVGDPGRLDGPARHHLGLRRAGPRRLPLLRNPPEAGNPRPSGGSWLSPAGEPLGQPAT